MPERYKYLIIGGGLAADAAVRGIRELDHSGTILVVSDEDDPPYNRPPLSKGLWKGTAIDEIWRHTETTTAELRLGTRIVALDSGGKTATDARGRVVGYDKLLLATGGSPRRLGNGNAPVIYFRRLADFRQAWQAAGEGAEFAVLGGGFIGAEIAAALASNGRKVTLVFPHDGIGSRVYPRPLANFLNVYFRKHGVDVRFNERVEAVERGAAKLIVRSNGHNGIAVDTVIAGLGIVPNVELAQAADLAVGDGIIVDEMLRTSHPDIFAAGDVANFPCAALGRRLRFEHEDNAATMGRAAGRNMADAFEPYQHLPFFYSDLFDLGYEAVGEIDSSLETVEDWAETFHKGVVYYLKDRRVRGVLLWNSWGLVDAARELIASERAFTPAVLRGRLRETG
ncbi:MAG: NAD(P)/FAD-dependent oxidoreductase [Xanthobacteraceae bacterium]|nr:MAG: NAD(P)/FAD-dependent oxidoreductase [Xanthobacteraceae bacterium]